MKNLIRTFFVALFILTVGFANAQSPKFGHIDIQALIQIMPERAVAATTLEKETKDMEGLYGDMQAELQSKFEEFEKLGTDASDLVKNAKATEIQDLQQRVQSFNQQAQQQLQQKRNELLQPIFEKAQTAIGEVGKEMGLLYVFDISSGVVIYKSNDSVDVLPLVKTKLGIQ